MASQRRSASSSFRSRGVGPPRPALLTSTSRAPKRATAARIASRTEAASLTLQATARASAPSSPRSSAIPSIANWSREARTTRAPSFAKRRAIASPMPREAPVTIACLPERRRASVIRPGILPGEESACGLAQGFDAAVGLALAAVPEIERPFEPALRAVDIPAFHRAGAGFARARPPFLRFPRDLVRDHRVLLFSPPGVSRYLRSSLSQRSR